MARCHEHRGEAMAPEDWVPSSGRVHMKYLKSLPDLRPTAAAPEPKQPQTNVGCSAEAHTKHVSGPIFSIKANILVITTSSKSLPLRFISFGKDQWTGDICSALCKLAEHSPNLLWTFLNSHSENSSFKNDELLFLTTSNTSQLHCHVNGTSPSIKGSQVGRLNCQL